MGRFWSRCTPNFTRFLHEHGLTVSNAIPLTVPAERPMPDFNIAVAT